MQTGPTRAMVESRGKTLARAPYILTRVDRFTNSGTTVTAGDQVQKPSIFVKSRPLLVIFFKGRQLVFFVN